MFKGSLESLQKRLVELKKELKKVKAMYPNNENNEVSDMEMSIEDLTWKIREKQCRWHE